MIKLRAINYFHPWCALVLSMGGDLCWVGGLLPFLTQTPSLQWSYDGGTSWEFCNTSEACGEDSSMIYKINHNSRETILNWNTEFDLIWADDFKIGLFGSIYFLGFAIGAITLLRLADKYGRKPVLAIWVGVSFINFLGLYLAKNIILVYSLLFLTGALTIAKGTLFYLYFLELLPERKKIKYHTVSGLIGLLIGISTMWFFYYIENGLLWFPILIAVTLLHSVWIWVWPESPRFLYSQGRFDELHRVIAYIAKINGVHEWNYRFTAEIDENHEDFNSQEVSLLTALKDSRYRNNLMIMTVNWIVCSLSFYIVNFYTGEFPGNMYINAGVMVIADLMTWVVSIPFITYLGTKYGFITTFICVIAVTVLYTLFGNIQSLAYFFVFWLRFWLVMGFSLSYFSTSELFDVNIKSRSFAVCNFFARTFTIASPMIVQVVPKPILVISWLSILSAVLSQFIKQKDTGNDQDIPRAKEA